MEYAKNTLMFYELFVPLASLFAGLAVIIFRKRYLELLESFNGEQPALMPFVVIIVGIGMILISVSLLWRFVSGIG